MNTKTIELLKIQGKTLNQELMKPRYKVIKDYPLSMYHVGAILYLQPFSGDSFFHPTKDYPEIHTYFSILRTKLDDYPEFFKKLQWWEDRTIEEMPNKVVSLILIDEDKLLTYYVESWDLDSEFGYVNKNMKQGFTLSAVKPEYGILPIE